MPDPQITKLVKKNLLYTIKTAVGSELFRHIYARRQDGEDFDALEDGALSCANVVGGVLALHGLIDRPHATVETTLKEMELAGWEKVANPTPGSVIVWPPSEDGHMHIGFYVDDEVYMSNSSAKRHPILHGKRLEDGREPVGYYTHPTLL